MALTTPFVPPHFAPYALATPAADVATPTYIRGPKVWQEAYQNTMQSSHLGSVGDETELGSRDPALAPPTPQPSALTNWSIVNDTLDRPPYANEGKNHYSLAEIILMGFFASLLSIVTVVGNLMVMISFKMDKQLQTISNYFLLSLAIADFSIGLISMPLFTYYTLYNYWHLGPFICDTWLAWDYLASNASVLNLLIISFDRYFSVTRPLTYRARRTTRRAAIMIASAWVISLLLWPPWIYSWPYIEGQRSVPEGKCYIQFLETNSYVTFGTALAAFYVPVTVMCILYWRIWRETEKRQRDLTHLQAGKKEGSRKSTSSGDEPVGGETTDDYRRPLRSDSCLNSNENALETTYVPTSLCVETSKYITQTGTSSSQGPGSMARNCTSLSLGSGARGDSNKNALAGPRRLKNMIMSWCRIDRDATVEKDDDSNSSHGSPGAQTPASIETPIQTASRTTSMNFRADQVVQLNPNATGGTGSTRSRDIPMTDRNGLRGRSATAGSRGGSTTSNPASRSFSSDSVYTILIRLPTQPSVDGSLEGETSQPSIKMILEEGESADSVLDTRLKQIGRSASSDIPDQPTRGVLKNAGQQDSIETIRIPLNAKLVHKQVVVKQRQPKKKRKQQERKQEKKAAKTLSAILFAFIVTWTPYNVLVLIKTLSLCENGDCIPAGLWDFAYCLCYINSTVNPLCYALCNANFRRTYIRILSCKWHTSKHQRNMNRGYFS